MFPEMVNNKKRYYNESMKFMINKSKKKKIIQIK